MHDLHMGPHREVRTRRRRCASAQRPRCTERRRTRSARENRKPTRSTVRHTRQISRDRSKRTITVPPDEEVVERLREACVPAADAQTAAFYANRGRKRKLPLEVMLPFVISLVWGQCASVTDALRTLRLHGVLWQAALKVSQQAMSSRLMTFPAGLFHRAMMDVLGTLHRSWEKRQRVLPPALEHALGHFTRIVALDGSTLDELARRVGFKDDQGNDKKERRLAGRMAALLDVARQLPMQVWYEADSKAHDQRFWEDALSEVKAGMLLLFDLGFVNHAFFDLLTDKGVRFVTRAKANAAFRVTRILHDDPCMRDQIVLWGGRDTRCKHEMRLVQRLHQGKWYRYLTNELNPKVLPPEYVVAIYYQRWRIEDAFNIVKRILGLAYLWVGNSNGVQMQIWATWLLYAALVDITDSVAERLQQPYGELSLEMVFRGLPHFALSRRDGIDEDMVEYLANRAQVLGIIKRKRKGRSSPGELLHLTLAQLA